MVPVISWGLLELQLVKWSTIMCDCLAIHLVLDAQEITVQHNNCRNSLQCA